MENTMLNTFLLLLLAFPRFHEEDKIFDSDYIYRGACTMFLGQLFASLAILGYC